MQVQGTLNALKINRNRLYKGEPLIHHSDRGIQYCSDVYQRLLKQYHIILSMTESYDPYANAIAERVNGILKQEFMLEELNLPMMDMKRVIKVLFINITILDHIIRVGTKYPSICRGRIIKRNNSVRLTLLSCAKCFIFVQ